MAKGQVRLRLNLPALNAQVGTISKAAVSRGATAMERRARNNIILADLIHSGEMLAGMQQREVPSAPLFPRVAVGSPAKQVLFTEFGTKGHGPVRAKRLRFVPKGSNRVVYAKWVRGIRAYAFMKSALDMARPADFE